MVCGFEKSKKLEEELREDREEDRKWSEKFGRILPATFLRVVTGGRGVRKSGQGDRVRKSGQGSRRCGVRSRGRARSWAVLLTCGHGRSRVCLPVKGSRVRPVKGFA